MVDSVSVRFRNVRVSKRCLYLWGLNHYSQLSDFWELIRIKVTVTVIIFPGINYITVMSPLQFGCTEHKNPGIVKSLENFVD